MKIFSQFLFTENSAGKTDEPMSHSERILQLMSGHLSRSQLDLVMHGPDDPTAPGHAKPRQADKVNNTFIETEKNSGRDKKPTTSDDQTVLEMSSL